jgi:hypothetical protein
VKTLMIDDLPHTKPYTADVYAKNYYEGIEELKKKGWSTLFLDHDLGDSGWPTGMDVLNWLEANPEYLPDEIVIISRSPRKLEMKKLVNKLYGKGYGL